MPAENRIFNRAQSMRYECHALRMFHNVFVAGTAHQRPAANKFHSVEIRIKIKGVFFVFLLLRLHKNTPRKKYFVKFCRKGAEIVDKSCRIVL